MSQNDKPVFQFAFLRHGESIGNVESRWQGQADYPLTEKGRAQVRSLAGRWIGVGEVPPPPRPVEGWLVAVPVAAELEC